LEEELANSEHKLQRPRTHSQHEQEVIDNIKEYIQDRDASYSSWCIGIAGEPHDVVLHAHAGRSLFWMYRETGSPQIARAVADYLVNTVGLDGSTGKRGTDDSGSVVCIHNKADGPHD